VPEVIVATWAAVLAVGALVILVVVVVVSGPIIKRDVVDVIPVQSTSTISRLKMEHHGRVFREPAVTA
jgi:hypothetical protein